MAARHWMIAGGLMTFGVAAIALVDPSDDAQPMPSGEPEAEAVEPAPPAGASELAVVAPLQPGADLAGWTVDRIEGVQNGTMVIIVRRAEEELRLEIALDDPGAPLAPAHTGRYAVYYNGGHDGAQAQVVAQALQAVIATHPDVEPPAGLGRIPTAPATDGT